MEQTQENACARGSAVKRLVMRGDEITRSHWHDAGAYGRCSYCGRYSDDIDCLDDDYPCICGRKNGFCGSFKKPTNSSIWHDKLPKILHLNLKKKWFDMILSGDKKEEYREIKPYWDKRLNKKYDIICFRNGYAKDAPKMLVELDCVQRSLGIVEWGAPPKQVVYVLRLGKVLDA